MFDLAKIENGRMNVAEPHYIVAKSGEAIAEGEALVLNGGALTKCGATAVPTYIACTALSAAATERKIPVIPVASNQIYRVATTASVASLSIGTKVTLSDDGTKVTATTASGVATIVDLNGASAAGDQIYIKF